MQMDVSLKASWLGALRSGQYVQGTEYLARGEIGRPVNFCCLGVLCEVIKLPKEIMLTKQYVRDPEDEAGEPRKAEFGCAYYTFGKEEMSSTLGENFMNTVGLNEADANMLMRMNDGDEEIGHHTFLEIADWIEQNGAI
jgi:hypothetical protein